ncbi:MAG TPA: iron-sulfur cluster assembly scaffold protein [Pyrinomonadaceae bacterium]|nr:iron-sulfur cluster assembly scaffold protein [Pyrinomonadaceae bacterium]
MSTTEILREHFLHPRNVGEADEPRFIGRAASVGCGALVEFSIQIDDTHKILQAKFRAVGCDVLVSGSSLLSEAVVGRSTAEAANNVQSSALVDEFEGIEDSRKACLALAARALISALQEYSNAAREEWVGEEALICTCFFVSERTIEHEIQDRGLTTISEVTRVCSAGGGCGSCHQLIQEILDSTSQEPNA